MRTTITLDGDNVAAVRRLMRERGMTFKQAVNESIRAGVLPRVAGAAFHTEAVSMGVPAVSLDKALQIAADLEDEEIVRKLGLRQ